MAPGSLKIAVLATAGALIVGAVAIGTALAQQPPPPPGQAQSAQGPRALLERVAAKLGIAPDRLEQAFREARQELQTERGPGPGGPRPGGPRGEVRERFRGMMHQALEIVANELHMTPEQLRAELPGNSLAAVSRNHGVDPQQVAIALTNAANQHIDAAVGQGRLTAEQATRMKQRVAEMIQRMMDRQLPARPVR